MTTVRCIASYFPARRLSVLLTIIATVLWAYSLSQAKLNLGPYGFIHSLPVSFFIALGLLTIASAILWVSPENHGKLLFLQLCLFITALWLTPLLIGGIGNSQPSFSGTVGDLGNSDYIIRYGYFSPEASWRLNWPGVFIFAATIAEILGMASFDVMIAVFPFLWQFVLLLPLYLIFKNTLGEGRSNYCWAAAWIYYLGNWVEGGMLHTQILSLLFLLTMLAVFTGTSAWQAGSRAVFSRLSGCLLLAGLTITHLLTSLYAVIMMTALNVARRIKISTLIIIGVVFILSWLLYEATGFFETSLPSFVDRALRLDLFWETSVASRVIGSPEHQTVVQIRLLTTVLFGVIGVAGFILGLRHRTRSDTTMLAIGLSAAILAIAMGAGYGFELTHRALIFIMLPVAYFATRLLDRRITASIFLVLLLTALPLNIISHYGNQATDYSSPPTIASWHFFHDNTTRGLVVGGSPFGDMKNFWQYKHIYFQQLEGKGDPLAQLPADYPRYMCLSRQDQAVFDVVYDKPRFIQEIQSSLDKTTNYNLIYTNPDVRIYIDEGGR